MTPKATTRTGAKRQLTRHGFVALPGLVKIIDRWHGPYFDRDHRLPRYSLSGGPRPAPKRVYEYTEFDACLDEAFHRSAEGAELFALAESFKPGTRVVVGKRVGEVCDRLDYPGFDVLISAPRQGGGSSLYFFDPRKIVLAEEAA